MDRDRKLIAHLDAKFEGIEHRFEEIQEQIRENTTSVDAKLEAFASHIDAKFEGVDQRFEGMQGQMDRRFDETQEQIRHTNVVVEELGSKVKAIAEGHLMLGNKLDRLAEELKVERQLDRGETRSSIKRLRERVDRLEATR